MWQKIWRRHWQGLVIEMFAVFIGVSAAFALDNYRELAEKAERRQQFIAVVLKDLEKLADDLAGATMAFESGAPGQWLTAYKQNSQPALMPVLIPEVNRGQVWLALLQSGTAAAVDIPLLSNVEAYILEFELLDSQIKQYNALIMAQLMPKVGAEKVEFYDAETGKLRGPYLWYPQYLKQFKNQLLALQSSTQALAEHLRLVKD